MFANSWLQQMFDAAIVGNRGIVRRKKASVHQHASFEELQAEVVSRGFHLIETGDQYIVICNRGAIIIHC